MLCYSFQPVIKYCFSFDRSFLLLIHPALPHPYHSSILSPQSTDRRADSSTHRCQCKTKTCGKKDDEVDRQGKWERGRKDGNNDIEWRKSREPRNKMRHETEAHVEMMERVHPLTNNIHRGLSANMMQLQHTTTLKTWAKQQLHQNQPVKNKRWNNNSLLQAYKKKIWSPWQLWAEGMQHTKKMVGGRNQPRERHKEWKCVESIDKRGALYS